MIERVGDIWRSEARVICITTNGMTRINGNGIMGAGIAKQARNRVRHIETALGIGIRTFGNVVQRIGVWESPGGIFIEILSFPTKNDWRDPSDLELIQKSAEALTRWHEKNGRPDNTYALTRPGCGNGGLDWTVVRSVLEPILREDRYIIFTPGRSR